MHELSPRLGGNGNQAVSLPPLTCRGPAPPDVEDAPFRNAMEHLAALHEEVLLRAAACLSVSCSSSAFPMPEAGQDMPGDTADVGNDAVAAWRRAAERNRRCEVPSQGQDVDLPVRTMCLRHGLDDRERDIVLFLFFAQVSEVFARKLEELGLPGGDAPSDEVRIGTLLRCLGLGFEEQVRGRACFSVTSRLVKGELIQLSGFSRQTGVASIWVSINPHLVRLLLGDENVYLPILAQVQREMGAVPLERVILPEERKRHVLQQVRSFHNHKDARQRLGLLEHLGYGAGLVLLFQGASGTGKTMLAHAISHELGAPLLSVNFQALERADGEECDALRLAFLEAGMHGGIVFLDECDDVVRNDSHISRNLLLLLEKTQCLVILATNQAEDLDPAMDRRITCKVRFEVPGAEQRVQLWRALLPPAARLARDVDLEALARRYVLTGGLIKNAILTALNEALASGGDDAPVLDMTTLESACREQCRSMFDDSRLLEPLAANKPLGELGLEPHDLDALRRLSAELREATARRELLLVGLHCPDPVTGQEVAAALAAAAGLGARKAMFSRLVAGKQPHDRFWRQEPRPLELLQRASLGRESLLVLGDDIGFLTQGADVPKPQADPTEILETLERCSMPVLILCTGAPSRSMPEAVHLHHVLGTPPPWVQEAQWRSGLGAGWDTPERAAFIAAMVRRHPLATAAIDRAARKAVLRGRVVHGRGVEPGDVEHVLRGKGRGSWPLFGAPRDEGGDTQG